MANVTVAQLTVEDVVPQAISIVKENMDGETIEDFRLLDTSPLIPILIKAIKELNNKIDKLENRSF